MLESFNVKSEDDFKLQIFEVIGSLALMLHWQRGIIDSLVQNENVKLNETQHNNWNRVIKNLELYEKFVWEIAPARAFLLAMRDYRLTGKVVEKYEVLAHKDDHGRIPYGLSKEELDDIDDIIRKLKDARQTTGYYGHAFNLAEK